MLSINANTVLITIVIDIIFFNPTRIQILLLQSLWAFIPSIWYAIRLYFFIIFPPIALLWDRNKCGINDLSTTGSNP